MIFTDVSFLIFVKKNWYAKLSFFVANMKNVNVEMSGNLEICKCNALIAS